MKTNLRTDLNNLQLSDIYSLMLFVLYKLQDVAEYATLSELCFLLDGSNLTRLLTYFEGKTLKVPTSTEFAKVTKAMLLYQYINIEGLSLADALKKLGELPPKQQDDIVQTYLEFLPILKQYNIDRGQIKNV